MASASSQYTSIFPEGSTVDEGVKRYFERFYWVSDNGDLHDEYANSFTKDATLVMASKRGVGFDEILQIRKGMWATVASRSHDPIKIFPFSNSGSKVDEEEVMLYGTVAYVLKDGRKAEVEWAARAELVKVEGEWKMKFYQVYLDTAAMQNAK